MKTSGAEAIIYLNENNNIEKSRIKKDYRILEIDSSLRFSRTKTESKILQKLQKIINVPKLIKVTDYDIEMEYIDGKQLKSVFDKRPELAQHIGKNLTLMHENNIIHGDLTTSNIILKRDSELLYFIDFGLSFMSARKEDKAVDIHLFKQSLESKHFKIAEIAYKEFLKGYNPKNKREILERLRVVEQRGKYKEKT